MTPQSSLQRTTQIARMWARVCQYHSVTLGRLASRVTQSADLARIDNLGREMAQTLQRDPTCAAKYTDHAFWLPFNVERIGKLALHKSPRLRILDVGCGPGYFLAAARACGHDCYGVDAPPNILTDVERRVYAELLAALRCSDVVTPVLIERYVPMTVAQRDLDLITAFWICFNRHRQPDEWGAEEWRFLVDDAMSHLRPGGLLHLELNGHAERYAERQWYDQQTLDFFRSVGTVENNVVRVRKGGVQS
jgi:SAM-dependent methyltransferase